MVTRVEVPDRDGTRLAITAVVSASPPLRPSAERISPAQEAWRRSRDQFFIEDSDATARKMLKFGLLVEAVLVTFMVHGGYPTWRIVGSLVAYVLFGIVHRLLVVHARCKPDHSIDQTFIWMNVTSQLFLVGNAVLTGGAHSPFIPGTLLPAILSLLFFGPHAVSRWMAAANGLLILGVLCLPTRIVGPTLPDVHFVACMFIGIGWNLFILHMLVGKLAFIANRTGQNVACLREERLTELDAQLHRLQSVGAKVAHELKNPLASIKGLCQLVARTPESERTQERLAVVASEISRMDTILGEYLSFSRPLEDLEPQPIDLHVVTQDVLDVLAGRAEQAGVTLVLDGTPTPAQGDPRRLKEALINLVSNAIEATPTGGRVTTNLRTTTDGVLLEVRDTGRGISADDLARLGTSFFTTRPNGTGLGVVLAQGVIAQHGGQLRYASIVGSGTTATITLPRTMPPCQRLPIASIASIAPSSSARAPS
ncbi:MAG: HAMP domain-containing sensor histidine kinase [Proteobacteria bacterium]|nr:HAMP domain-containing sensor histidine kinase [Pseudomonadota bacterium]